jgi:predicted nuclease of predicted toxin-antitoxin system
MKIKLDENMPVALQGALGAMGHDVDTAAAEGLAGKPDEMVRRFATAAGRFLITQDLDFSDIRSLAPGTHPGVLLVRLRDPGRSALLQRIASVFRTEPIESWKGCLVVLSDLRLRIRRPTSAITSGRLSKGPTVQ